MKKKNEPTDAELEILNILWELEPVTVRTIHENLLERKEAGYTTTLKLMQNMAAKGLLKRELKGKSHLYSSVYKKEETRQRLLNKFLDRTFAGSSSSLVMQLLGNNRTTASEFEEIRKIIDQMEQNKNS